MESPLVWKNPRLLASLAGGVLALSGCTPLDPRVKEAGPVEHGRDGTVAYYISVEASEPGVRIEADGDSVGVAPLKLKVFGDRDGTFHSFGSPDYTVKAYSAGPQHTVQTKTFGTGTWFGREDRIPSKIYFDMSAGSDGTVAAPR